MAVEVVASGPILDVEGTLARFGGDKALFVEMSGILLADAPRLIAELGRAVVANNAVDMRMRAHAVKGLLAGCGGVRAAHVAQLMEDAGQSSDLRHVTAYFETLSNEFDQLARALQQYGDSAGTA
jgi:HPt (histidine-containing phosphotransfer) domain-containing protein